MWYWFPKQLPAPLDRVGLRDGPRCARVRAGDIVTLVLAHLG